MASFPPFGQDGIVTAYLVIMLLIIVYVAYLNGRDLDLGGGES